MATTPTRGLFATRVLKGIGAWKVGDAKGNRKRVAILLAWMRGESGNEINDGTHPGGGAAFNPMGSTWPYSYPEYNSVGVRNYPDFQTGYEETAATLLLPDHNYEPIIAALKAGHPKIACDAIAASQWGTGNGARDAWPYTWDHYAQERDRPVGEFMP